MKHCMSCLIIYYFKATRLPLNTPWLVLKFWIYFALKSFVGVFLGFPNSWLLITKGVKRCLTSTCLMDKSDFSLHLFIKNKIYSSLEARVYSQFNAVVAYTCMVHHTCISFNANFCSFSMVCSCAMSSDCVWLQIIFCSYINETMLFSFFAITLAWKCRLLRFPKIFVKNKLGNQMIKQFLNSVIVKYYDLSASKPKAEANNWSVQPCPILVTSAEREVKVSRRSGMYQSYNFLTRLGMQSL